MFPLHYLDSHYEAVPTYTNYKTRNSHNSELYPDINIDCFALQVTTHSILTLYNILATRSKPMPMDIVSNYFS